MKRYTDHFLFPRVKGRGMPRVVTVIIPAYNEAKVAPRCIDSVLAQTYKNLEIILVDDGSSDGTGGIFDEYARRDNRVRVVRQQNAGPGAARNAGLAAATGEFIQFVDADDRLLPTQTRSLVEAIVTHRADMAMGGFTRTILRNGKVAQIRAWVPESCGCFSQDEYTKVYSALPDPNRMLFFFALWTKMYRLDVIRRAGLRLDATMTCWEDGLFNMLYLSQCRTVAVVGTAGYEYLEEPDKGQVAGGNVYRRDGADNAFAVGKFFFSRFGRAFSTKELHMRMGIFANYLIIFMVNMCRRDALESRRQITARLAKLIGSPEAREWFRHYRPKPGQSWLIPLLVKCRLPRMLFMLCRVKADKRYGRHYNFRAEERRGLKLFS